MANDRGTFDLSGRVALVTGGGHGLGRAISEAMAEFGADVAVVDRSPDAAQETVALLNRFGTRTVAITADVSIPADVNNMVTCTTGELGGLDILFCNAGIGNAPARLHELQIAEWDRVMAVNLRGTFLCLKAAIPAILARGRGSIILTSSVAGRMAGSEAFGFLRSSPYGVSKAGLIMLTRYVAAEYAKDGLRVNCIAPGGHETCPVGIPKEVLEEASSKLVPYIPMGRLGQPGEIKGLALYLASDASSYVTGQTFIQDGGFTA